MLVPLASADRGERASVTSKSSAGPAVSFI